MKKKLLLQTVIHIKDDLSRNIVELQKDIIKYNNTEINPSSLLDSLEKTESQIIVIKEAIQKANRDKHKDGKTNNYYIYKLSNLNSRRAMTETLIDKVKRNSHLSEEKLKKDLNNILTEIEQIRSKLSTFNSNHKVTIELDESLNLLNE